MDAADKGSLVDDAYQWLLDEITNFRLRAGAPLSENRIAAQLGTSRTPVRAALQRLEKEGLVSRTDSARFAVPQLTVTEVNDACDLLEVLDSYVCEKAASKLTDSDAEALRKSVATMTAAAASGDIASWASADLAFHRLINGIAGNHLVAETLKETRRRIHRFWLRAAAAPQRLQSCSAEHEILAEAMIDKNYPAIKPAVKKHIDHMRNRILDMLEAAAMLLGND